MHTSSLFQKPKSLYYHEAIYSFYFLFFYQLYHSYSSFYELTPFDQALDHVLAVKTKT